MSHRTEHSGLVSFQIRAPRLAEAFQGVRAVIIQEEGLIAVGPRRAHMPSRSSNGPCSITSTTCCPLQIRTRSTVADTTLDSIPQGIEARDTASIKLGTRPAQTRRGTGRLSRLCHGTVCSGPIASSLRMAACARGCRAVDLSVRHFAQTDGAGGIAGIPALKAEARRGYWLLLRYWSRGADGRTCIT